VSVAERPQQSSDQQLELVEGISPRGLTYLCTEKAGYINCPAVHLPSLSLPIATASRRWPWRAATST
jgi:hypothetical protein